MNEMINWYISSPWNLVGMFFVIYYSMIMTAIEENTFLVRFFGAMLLISGMGFHIFATHGVF